MNCYLCPFISQEDHGWWCRLKYDYIHTEERRQTRFGRVPNCDCQVSDGELEMLRDEINEELESRKNRT